MDPVDPIVPRRWIPFHDDKPVAEEVVYVRERVAGRYDDWALDGAICQYYDEWAEVHYLVRFEKGIIYLIEGKKGNL